MTHRNWPFEDTISVFWGEFRQPLAALDRCTLNKGAFSFKIVQGGGGTLKWPLKGGSRLIGGRNSSFDCKSIFKYPLLNPACRCVKNIATALHYFEKLIPV